MKVTTSSSAMEQPNSNVSKATNKRGVAEGSQPLDDESPLGGTQGRDFASVLEDVGKGRERHEDANSDNDKSEARASERADREREAERRDNRQDGEGKGGGFDQRSGIHDVALHSEATNARSILHIADLERIVAAVRTQTLAGGRREVTLEMQRSVLEGLRVKLSTDEKGRVTAEFIASTEKMRGQLDARSNELAELLRSRGVDVAALRTSVGADSSGSAQGSEGQARDDSPNANRNNIAGASSSMTAGESAQSVDYSSDEGASTYRA